MFDPASTAISPPRKLGVLGSSLWQSIQAEYRVDDAAGRELLAQACAADRVARLSEKIDADGEVIETKAGVKVHPAVREELAGRQFICERCRHWVSIWRPSARSGVRRRGGSGKRIERMPTNRKYIRRPQRLPLSATQEMELWLGPGRDGTAFASDEHRREAWFRYRDRLMQRWAKGGRRPLGWWWYEASERGLPPRHPALHERSILYEFSDVLSAEERAELEAEWRKEFDRTWDTNFSFYADGKYYTGDVARELAWIAMDLPMVLHDKFMAERKRRGRTIRELEEESSTGQQQSR